MDAENISTILPIDNISTMVVANQSRTSIDVTLKLASDIVIKSTLIIIMLGMGSATEIKPLIHHIKRPTGICIGMLSQFFVLPLLTFGLAHALQLPDIPALGMLVMGCCPSGSTSNMFTFWVDGDVPLSISMTTVSTILAFGMLPLNLLIYSRSWTSDTLVIPYVNILISFAMTIIPVLAGMFIRWKWPKAANFVVKCGSIVGAVSVVLTLTLLSLLYPFMYNAVWNIYLGAILLPFSGFTFGYIVATIFRMEKFQRRTVALETGIQNFPLCMTLLILSFSKDMFVDISLFPLLYGVTCILASVIFALSYKIIQRASEKRKYLKDKQEKHDDFETKESKLSFLNEKSNSK